MPFVCVFFPGKTRRVLGRAPAAVALILQKLIIRLESGALRLSGQKSVCAANVCKCALAFGLGGGGAARLDANKEGAYDPFVLKFLG